MTAVWGLTALLCLVGVAWLVADYRYAARLDSFDRHCQDATEMGADDFTDQPALRVVK